MKQFITRLRFVLRLFYADFSAKERTNMLLELYFQAADTPTITEDSMFDLIDLTFGDRGYEPDDYLHVLYLLKLDHFRRTKFYVFFDEVPKILKRSVHMKAIKACIDYFQHDIPLPEYNEFIQKHCAFYNQSPNDNRRI